MLPGSSPSGSRCDVCCFSSWSLFFLTCPPRRYAPKGLTIPPSAYAPDSFRRLSMELPPMPSRPALTLGCTDGCGCAGCAAGCWPYLAFMASYSRARLARPASGLSGAIALLMAFLAELNKPRKLVGGGSLTTPPSANLRIAPKRGFPPAI